MKSSFTAPGGSLLLSTLDWALINLKDAGIPLEAVLRGRRGVRREKRPPRKVGSPAYCGSAGCRPKR